MPLPTPGAVANRRLLVYLIIATAFVSFLFVGLSRSSKPSLAFANTPIHHVEVGKETLQGGAIMSKMANETLKAELGRASWKLFHTIMASYPEKPTEDEQTALFSYIHLFARLYPCGECAGHFRQILTKSPPQVKTRNAAAGWACHVHNEVNLSLKKPVFDCSKIGEFYDCGCEKEDKGNQVKDVKGPGQEEEALVLKKDSQTLGG